MLTPPSRYLLTRSLLPQAKSPSNLHFAFRSSFHSTPNRPFIEPAIVATHHLLELVHTNTGLPWIASLPIGALIIRTVFTTPLSIYSQRILQRQAALSPLIQAWQHQIRRQVIAEAGTLGPNECDRRARKAIRKKSRELYNRWGCQRWKLYLPFVQAPVFLVTIETIRRMCGTQEGLLGLALKQFRSGGAVAVDTSREAALGMLKDADGSAVGLEDSLALEGGLWFQNLLEPDPLLLLPFILSGTLLASLSVQARRRSGVVAQSVVQTRLSNALKFMAILIVPATLQVPSAMLVYWISSAAFAFAQSALLSRIMPFRYPLMSSVK
ncbi:MAG: hypothetical protein M1816_007977 [Peltula sp. TS41687]|nr:MAG: hypothetical protein M1816_007977 [Peltula sp. TS41687]